jgi:hypothetical protein
MSNRTCQRCHGKGYHYQKIQNLGTRDYEQHIVSCLMCDNGVPNIGRYLCSIGGPGWERWLKDNGLTEEQYCSA